MRTANPPATRGPTAPMVAILTRLAVRSSSSEPIAVVLDEECRAELERRAMEQGVSSSAVAARLLASVLRPR